MGIKNEADELDNNFIVTYFWDQSYIKSHISCRSESSYYCFVIHNNFWIVKFIYNTLELSDSAHLYWSVSAESIKSKLFTQNSAYCVTAVKSISGKNGKGDSEIKK